MNELVEKHRDEERQRWAALGSALHTDAEERDAGFCRIVGLTFTLFATGFVIVLLNQTWFIFETRLVLSLVAFVGFLAWTKSLCSRYRISVNVSRLSSQE